uniref:VWFA domain-containing protein n=1 Tax=Panagrolaimus superbus TaxID=310955 RepID=A0A914YWH6_9BILA
MASEDIIELEFKVDQLPIQSRQGCRVLVSASQFSQDIEVGKTEKRFDISSITFNEKVKVFFRLGETQEYKVHLLIYRPDSEDIERIAGETTFNLLNVLKQSGTLTTIMPSENFTLNTVPILTVTAQGGTDQMNGTFLQFSGHSLDPRNRHQIAAYFVLSLIPKGNGMPVILYRSEVINKNSPKWKEFIIPTRYFSTSSEGILEFSCYNFNNNTEDSLIGKFSTSFYQLLRGAGAINKYILHCAAGKKKEEMSIELCKIGSNQTVSSFPTFIAAGLQLHFTISIDFTTNNGNQNEATSLHYQHPHMRSIYGNRLKVVADGLEALSPSSKISLLGFGAKVPPDMQFSQCFAMNGNILNPFCRNLIDVEEYYRRCALSVLFFAPTNYSNVISNVTKQAIAAERSQRNLHFVLVILTNGNVSNVGALKDTCDEIVKASKYPISIIFVGIGNAQHPLRLDAGSKFMQIFSPNLKSTDGVPLKRETAVFVDGSDENTIPLLSTQIFNSVSRQMTLFRLNCA